MSSDLHVTLLVTRDDAERVPVVYLRDRVDFTDEWEALVYADRLRDWIARRPSPDPEQLPVSPPAADTWQPEQLFSILDRMDEWAPLPARPCVFDFERMDAGEVRR